MAEARLRIRVTRRLLPQRHLKNLIYGIHRFIESFHRVLAERVLRGQQVDGLRRKLMSHKQLLLFLILQERLLRYRLFLLLFLRRFVAGVLLVSIVYILLLLDSHIGLHGWLDLLGLQSKFLNVNLWSYLSVQSYQLLISAVGLTTVSASMNSATLLLI